MTILKHGHERDAGIERGILGNRRKVGMSHYFDLAVCCYEANFMMCYRAVPLR